MNSPEVFHFLNRCLQERNSLFPERNAKNDEEVEKALTLFTDYINGEQQQNFIPDSSLIAKATTIINAPVFLCGSMKSGTTLLLELLDGHPQMVVLPGDTFLIGKIVKFTRFADLNLPYYAWDDWVKRMVNPTGQAPFWVFGEKIEPYVTFRQYLQYWYDELPKGLSSLLMGFVLSYYCSNPLRPAFPQKWIEKTPGNEFRIDLINKHFPNARFIHIVRDPRENLASLKRLYMTRGWNWDAVGMSDRLAESCQIAVENRNRLGRGRYHVLRYEELTENPQQYMHNVADFLEVNWTESLLLPTINHMPAHANSMYEDRCVTGRVRKSAGDKWQSVLTRAEQRAALGTLQSAQKVGYDWEKTIKDSVYLSIEKGWRMIRGSLTA